MGNAKLNEKPHGPLTTPEFRMLLEELASLCAEVGYNHRAYANPDLPQFRLLSIEEQISITSNLRHQLEILNATKTDVGSVLNNAASVWRAMSRFGLVPPSGLLERITDSHVVEIYDTESRQIFKTFNFLPLTTHTLEDLHCLPWYKLWKRDEEQHKRLLAALHKIQIGEVEGMIDLGSQAELVQEIGTECLRTGLASGRFATPLKNRNGRLAGFLSSFVVDRLWDAGTVH